MTTPRVPVGERPRVRPLVSPADLIKAVAELAPDDPERARAIAALLGLGSASALADAPSDQTVPRPEAPEVTQASAAMSGYSLPDYGAVAGVVPSRLIPLGGAEPATGSAQWLLAASPLDPPSSGQAGETLAVESLFEPRWTAGIIAAALATDIAGGPDLTRAVAMMARGLALGVMPSIPRPSLRRGAQVLVDLGAGMEPFRGDQESFVTVLGRTLGDDRVEVLYFEDCPGRGAGTPGAAEWTAYRAPRSGVPVVLLTDLGLGPAAGAARPREWRAFFDEVHAAGSPCIAFVPYPPERVPRLLRADVLVIRWDRPTTARWVTQRRAGVR